jgi:hypothetical protein
MKKGVCWADIIGNSLQSHLEKGDKGKPAFPCHILMGTFCLCLSHPHHLLPMLHSNLARLQVLIQTSSLPTGTCMHLYPFLPPLALLVFLTWFVLFVFWLVLTSILSHLWDRNCALVCWQIPGLFSTLWAWWLWGSVGGSQDVHSRLVLPLPAQLLVHATQRPSPTHLKLGRGLGHAQ